jgi:hypothetical protein
MPSTRSVLLTPHAFTRQPLGREINCGALGQQFALRGADKAGFHQARLFKGSANLGKLIRILLDILVRFPRAPAIFQDRATLGQPLRMRGTIFSQVQLS